VFVVPHNLPEGTYSFAVANALTATPVDTNHTVVIGAQVPWPDRRFQVSSGSNAAAVVAAAAAAAKAGGGVVAMGAGAFDMGSTALELGDGVSLVGDPSGE
jgi:hypothetical protein